MKKNIGIVLYVLIAALGCTFNVREESKSITLEGSTAGLTKVSLSEAFCDDTEMEIFGIDTKSFALNATARMLLIENSDDDLDKLHLNISQSGEIGLSYTGDNWQCIEVDDLVMSIDKSIDFDLESVAGNITISKMEGFLTLNTVSGNCNVTAKKGCSIKTTSGDVELSLGSDSLLDTAAVYIKTVSGDIDIFLPEDTMLLSKTVCAMTVKSTSGDVTITVPRGFTANLVYTTTSGDKEVSDLFILNSAAKNFIKCTTSSGDLEINCYAE